jgi:hypothetical protein
MISGKIHTDNPTLFGDIIEIDELVRSRRRTISIIIENDARIIVRAPNNAPMSDILDFVRSKKTWIINKQTEIRESLKKNKTKLFLTGEKFLYKGNEYPLQFQPNLDFAFKFDGEKFVASIEIKDNIKQIFEKWYKLVAKSYLGNRTEELSEQTGLKISTVKINSAKRRWGSCSGKKTINYTWRLILTPEFVIDYIIIHELAHTVEMNHSPNFWNIVSKHCPDYRKAEKWLKNNSNSVHF